MRLILTSLHADLADAWEATCGDLGFVEVWRGSIFDVACDALFSPANSFGFMNGGIDLAYSRRLGWHVQERLQRAIAQHHHGELLVGAAELVSTDDPSFPYMIAAPTMRMPQSITETANPYLAARAAFILWQGGRFRDGPHAGQPIGEHIRTLAMPGLGTGVGSVAALACARQVRSAIDDILLGQFAAPHSWGQVLERHEQWLGHPLSSP